MSETILNAESENTFEYKMRNINAQDIAPLATIISKIGVKEFAKCFQTPQIQAAIKNNNAENISEEIGMVALIDMAGVVISNIPKCIDDIFSFVASLTDNDIDTIRKIDIDVFAGMIIEIFQKEEFKKGFQGCFKIAKIGDMEFWDLLFKRYANPLILMQQMLDVGRLDEFIDNVLKFHNDEQKEDFIFKLWLHKEYEGNPSYEKFRADFFEPPQTAKTKSDFEAELKDTVLKSQQILESFSLN